MTEPEPNTGRRERLWLVAGALVGVVVAGVLIGVFILLRDGEPGTPAASRAPSPTASAGPAVTAAATIAARDDSLRAAQDAAVVLNTMDHRDVRSGLDRWESVATSPLLDELNAKRAETLSTVERARTTSTARVLAAAVAKIAETNANTEVLVAVEVTALDANGASTVTQVRMRLGMLQTAQGWRVSSMSRVDPA